MPAAIPLMVAATVVSAGAAVYSGAQQQKAANYNAKMANEAARATEMQTRESIRRQRINNEAIMGAQRSSALSSGVAESGSTLTSLMEVSRRLETNIADLATQGNAQALGYRNQASLYRMKGRAAMTSGILEGTGTLLSGASKVAEKY